MTNGYTGFFRGIQIHHIVAGGQQGNTAQPGRMAQQLLVYLLIVGEQAVRIGQRFIQHFPRGGFVGQ